MTPQTYLRRALGTIAAAALAVPLLLAVAPAQAVETPAPVNFASTVVPSSADPGEKVVVTTGGWAPGTRLQALVCGDLAIGGSSSCDLPAAVTASAGEDGTAVHVVKVRTPPRPCPCVVRVSTFMGQPLAANVPIEIRGHEIGTPPEQVEALGDLRVEDVEISNDSLVRTLMGLGGTATATVSLANRGEAAAEVPDLAFGFGRGDVEVDQTLASDLSVPAGATREVEIDLDVPLLAFGTHQVVVQFADGVGGTQSAGTTILPVGSLVLLVALLLVVVAWDLWRTREARARTASSRPGARRFLDDDGSYPLPEVVYLEDIGGYLIKPVVLKNSRLASKVEGRVTVCDLATLVEGQGTARFPNGESAAAPVGAGGISFFLRHDRSRDHGRSSGGSVGSGPGLSFFVRPDRHRDA